jgi:hypothetical protein
MEAHPTMVGAGGRIGKQYPENHLKELFRRQYQVFFAGLGQ